MEPPRYPRRRSRPGDPYADAPQLPEGEQVDIASIFPDAPSEHPIEIEIGPGRGTFVWERATAVDDVRILGLEVRRKWATIVDRKLHSLGLGHKARVLAEDARIALPRLSPSGCVRAVFFHFPDPWWKKRHEKRLVLGDVVQRELERLLMPGGELFFQTDVEHRFEQARAFLSTRDALEPAGDLPGDPTLAENPYQARSPREKRAIVDGLPVFRLRFKKRPAPAP